MVNVKYVDYAVARTLLNTVDDWLNSLMQAKSSPLWKFVRKHTDWLPLITRYLAGAGVTALMFWIAPYYLSATSSLLNLAQFMMVAAVGIFAAYKLAFHLGRAAEDSLDEWMDLSYICITDGDRKEVQLAKSKNRSTLIWGALKLVDGLLVSLVAKLIAYRFISTS